ncbi:N-acetylglucosamine-6-sulfatase-like [Musca autumnalis]|uniref:N-acetylglucosamine-6-sulfatase-like n=1 Tax=Musca autumnalis TaxID=221902 RepID=UPI003CEDCB18
MNWWLIGVVIFSVLCITFPSIGAKQPNVLFILTDDQDVILNGMHPMRNVRNLIGSAGATFENAYTSSPLCCPSRASILTGKYAHNHLTFNNSKSGGCYGSHWRSKEEKHSLATLLQDAGYTTFYAGKYLNAYHGGEVPPGWRHFYGLHGNSVYYNFTLRENDLNVSYSNVYLTDLLRDKALDFLDNKNKDVPFLALIAPPAPHQPSTPAERHKGIFKGTKAKRTPSFNKVDKEKHWLVAASKEIPDDTLNLMDSYFEQRWESLLAVDELVASVIHKLQQTGDLENTYVIYSSDNGYHVGQFAQPFDKRQPYETDIQVPLLIRGPSIKPGVVITTPTLLIDLLPTIMEWLHLPLDAQMDGQSLQPFLMNADSYDPSTDMFYHRGLLVQHHGEGSLKTYRSECPMWQPEDRMAECTVQGACHCQDSWNNTYACVRNFAYGINHLYCEFQDDEDFAEFYDMGDDAHQLNNMAKDMLAIERALYSLALKNLTKCVGAAACSINVF